MKNLGTYLFIFLHDPSWSLLPYGYYCSPSVLISLKIWMHARGKKYLHGETGSHATWSEFFSSKENFFQWSSSSLDDISTLWASHYTQEPMNNDNIQLTTLGVVPSISPLWENGHNMNSENFIFKYLIVSLTKLRIFEIFSPVR